MPPFPIVLAETCCDAWDPLPLLFSCWSVKKLFADVIESVIMGSDDTDIPESVTVEEIKGDGSCNPSATTTFFDENFNEPTPDEPDAMEESSRALGIEFILAVRDTVVPDKLFNCVFSDEIPTTMSLPRSSCDAIFLLFKLDDGLKSCKKQNAKQLIT